MLIANKYTVALVDLSGALARDYRVSEYFVVANQVRSRRAQKRKLLSLLINC
jgi:hypothetical protein